MNQLFKAVGISYRNAPLEVREAVTFTEEQCKQFLVRLRQLFDIDEALVLSTCNRTEIYYFSEHNRNRDIRALVDVFHANTQQPAAPYFKEYDHEEAITHLFEVSIGVDSLVLGDIQITNQTKKAYQWSADEGMAGPFIHRLMHTIFFTNKRVVQETAFHDGTASVSSSAVTIAEQYIQTFNSPRILIVGLGEIGDNVAENFKGTSIEVMLINRTQQKAIDRAAEFGFLSSSFENLSEEINEAHVVISAVQTSTPIIYPEMIENRNIPRLFIDLSVPRSISPSFEEMDEMILYNIDQLQERASAALKRREECVETVKSIIKESCLEFGNWTQEMEISPTIKRFKQALEEIRSKEMARYLDKMNEKEIKVLDRVTKNIIQKVIKLPVLQLKAACKRGDADNLVDVLNDLFNLEKDRSEHPSS